MKKAWILLSLLAMAALSSCSPQVYPLYMDVRQPSTSGVDLAGKNMAIVYQAGTDSLFDRGVASSLARALEADYYDGAEAVGIYSFPVKDSITVDDMHKLVMDTGGDVIFLLNSSLDDFSIAANQPVPSAVSPDSAYVCTASVSVHTKLRLYDSMGQDRIVTYHGNATLRPRAYNSGLVNDEGLKTLILHNMGEQAEDVGERISGRFLSTWKTESFSFYYYDSNPWIDALQYFADGKLQKAVDAWGDLATRGSDDLAHACAAFNLAQAFFLAGDYTFASSWLETADKLAASGSTEPLSLSAGLHKRLEKK